LIRDRLGRLHPYDVAQGLEAPKIPKSENRPEYLSSAPVTRPWHELRTIVA